MNLESKNYVFGPVPSRRLGKSLGIDLVPYKTCSYDCTYCQLGKTANRTMIRQAFVQPRVVLEELKKRLSESAKPDYITLSGSGEPTLCKSLDKLIQGIKAITNIPVVVLTNGSLFWDKDVREELLEADRVIPSLDAGNQITFERINRPVSGISFKMMVEGLIAFKEDFQNEFFLETFLLDNTNTLHNDIADIIKFAEKIHPDAIQLNTVARPPAYPNIRTVSPQTMIDIAAKFVPPASIIADFDCIYDNTKTSNSRQSVLDILKRRPCTVVDIATGLGIHENEAIKHLGELIKRGSVETIYIERAMFYKATH